MARGKRALWPIRRARHLISATLPMERLARLRALRFRRSETVPVFAHGSRRKLSSSPTAQSTIFGRPSSRLRRVASAQAPLAFQLGGHVLSVDGEGGEGEGQLSLHPPPPPPHITH